MITIFSSTTQSNNSNTALTQRPKQTGFPDINSPLIQEDGDNKVLKLRFDVSQYAPEEIVVKTVDNKLLVCIFWMFHESIMSYLFYVWIVLGTCSTWGEVWYKERI